MAEEIILPDMNQIPSDVIAMMPLLTGDEFKLVVSFFCVPEAAFYGLHGWRNIGKLKDLAGLSAAATAIAADGLARKGFWVEAAVEEKRFGEYCLKCIVMEDGKDVLRLLGVDSNGEGL